MPTSVPPGSARVRPSLVSASPKSPSRARPSSPIQTFAGLRSRWTMPQPWACSSPRVTSIAIATACSGSSRRRSAAASRPATSPPGMCSETMKGPARSSPLSTMPTMWGWAPSLPIAWASRRARASTASPTPSVSKTATATARSSSASARQVDALATAAAEESLRPVAARRQASPAGPWRDLGRPRRWRSPRARRDLELRSAGIAEAGTLAVRVTAFGTAHGFRI